MSKQCCDGVDSKDGELAPENREAQSVSIFVFRTLSEKGLFVFENKVGSSVSPFLGCGDSQSVSKFVSVFRTLCGMGLLVLENILLTNKVGSSVSPFRGCDDGEWNVGVDRREYGRLVSLRWLGLGVRIWFVSRPWLGLGVRAGFESKLVEYDDVE